MTRTRPRGLPPAGFTLVEMVVALAVTGIVAVAAAGLTGGLIRLAERHSARRAAWDANWVTRRALEEAFLGLEVGTDSLSSFRGSAAEVAFTSNLPTARGWSELRRLRLTAVNDVVILADDLGRRDTLARQVRAHYGYLLETGERSEWLGGWVSPATAPMAVRLILTPGHGTPDTLLLRIGRRG